MRKFVRKLLWILIWTIHETFDWNIMMYTYEINMNSSLWYFLEYFVRILVMKISWIWHEPFMRYFDWIWWYWYEINVNSSLWYFQEYLLENLSWNCYEFDMNHSWDFWLKYHDAFIWNKYEFIWNQYEQFIMIFSGIFRENIRYENIMNLTWSIHEVFWLNMMMILIWNQCEQFIMIFSGIFREKICHEILNNLIWIFHEKSLEI